MNRVTLFCIVTLLLGFTSLGGANPGGVGDGDFDMQCGGACHGDSSQNQTSPAYLELSLDSTPYLGLPVSITGKISGVQFSSSDVVGLFLLTDTTGHSDLPEDAGWSVLSDQNGGDNNYIELEASSLTSEYTISWTVRPEIIQSTEFYLSIHHGSDNVPFFGISNALSVTVQEIPENLPRLAVDYSPKITRTIGENTTMLVSTIDVQELDIEWRLVDGESIFVDGQSVTDQEWRFELPAAIQPSIIEWRATMRGDGPDQVTPWFRIAAQEPLPEINQSQIYLQSLALGVFFVGLVLTLHNRFGHTITPNGNEFSSFDEIGDDTTLDDLPPLPPGGLPPGWTLEQWKWYGHEYLEDMS